MSSELSVEGVASGQEEESPAKSCDQSAAAAAVCLLSEEEELMMSGDITQYLSTALGAWQEVWLVVRGEVGPLDLEQLFHRPLEMLQHLMLTAVMCSAHSQVNHTPLHPSLLCCVANHIMLCLQCLALT